METYQSRIDQTWTPLAVAGEAPLREIVRYATLVVNSHNTQPWKFVIRNRRIEIHPGLSRRLPVVDSDDRSLWISLDLRAGEFAARRACQRAAR